MFLSPSVLTLWVDDWGTGTVLLIVRCRAVSLASLHQTPVAFSPWVWQLKMSPGVQNCPKLSTAALIKLKNGNDPVWGKDDWLPSGGSGLASTGPTNPPQERRRLAESWEWTRSSSSIDGRSCRQQIQASMLWDLSLLTRSHTEQATLPPLHHQPTLSCLCFLKLTKLSAPGPLNIHLPLPGTPVFALLLLNPIDHPGSS